MQYRCSMILQQAISLKAHGSWRAQSPLVLHLYGLQRNGDGSWHMLQRIKEKPGLGNTDSATEFAILVGIIATPAALMAGSTSYIFTRSASDTLNMPFMAMVSTHSSLLQHWLLWNEVFWSDINICDFTQNPYRARMLFDLAHGPRNL